MKRERESESPDAPNRRVPEHQEGGDHAETRPDRAKRCNVFVVLSSRQPRQGPKEWNLQSSPPSIFVFLFFFSSSSVLVPPTRATANPRYRCDAMWGLYLKRHYRDGLLHTYPHLLREWQPSSDLLGWCGGQVGWASAGSPWSMRLNKPGIQVPSRNPTQVRARNRGKRDYASPRRGRDKDRGRLRLHFAITVC